MFAYKLEEASLLTVPKGGTLVLCDNIHLSVLKQVSAWIIHGFVWG